MLQVNGSARTAVRGVMGELMEVFRSETYCWSLMSNCLTMAALRSKSVLTSCVSSVDVIAWFGSKPTVARRSFTAGAVATLRIAVLILFVRSADRPAAAITPIQLLKSSSARELLESSARLAQVEDFGLRLAKGRRMANLGPISIVLREEPTARQAPDTLSRYLRLLNASLLTRIEDHGEVVLIREEILMDGALPLRQSVELAVGGRCTADQVAQHLAMDRRTLHRHLQAGGQTFSSMMKAVRAEFAVRQIRDSGRSMADLAELMGFSGPSALAFWFRRNFNCTVSAWRKTHLAAETALLQMQENRGYSSQLPTRNP